MNPILIFGLFIFASQAIILTKPSRSDDNLITKLNEKDIDFLYPFQSKTSFSLLAVETYGPKKLQTTIA